MLTNASLQILPCFAEIREIKDWKFNKKEIKTRKITFFYTLVKIFL